MLTQNKILPLILCILFFFSSINQAWPQSVEKQAVLAILTLNIARFTRWPKPAFSNAEATINLCIFGNNMVQQSFESIDKKVINNRSIHVINLSRLRNLKQCQLLYLSELEQSRLIPLLIELKHQPILTLGENIKFLQAGGMVGLLDIKGKIKLNINLTIVKQSNLNISSRLLKLANIVDTLSQSR